MTARLTRLGRIGIGAAFVVQPQLWMRRWISTDAKRLTATLVARALGPLTRRASCAASSAASASSGREVA